MPQPPRLNLLLALALIAPMLGGCLGRKPSLTAPEARLVIQCAPLSHGQSWEVREIIHDTIKNHTTTIFTHDKTRWLNQKNQANSGVCIVTFRSKHLNRAEVMQRTESLASVIARRFKLSGYEKATSLDVQ